MPLSDFYESMKGYVAAPAEVTVAKSPAIPENLIQVGGYLRTVLPLPLQYSPDTLRQFNRPGLSSFRAAPLGLSSINASSESVAIKTIQQSTNSILLETAGVPNANQKVLNLIPGSNITAVSDLNGGVTIAGSGSGAGDGLIHGVGNDWETDSAYVALRDEFMPVTGSVTGIGIGGLGWQMSGNTGNFQITEYHTGLSVLNMGEFTWTNSSNNNSPVTQGIGNLSLGTTAVGAQPDTYVMALPLLAFPNWKATFIWRFHRPQEIPFNNAPNFGKKSIYIGFANNILTPVGGWSRPPIFIGARIDTDPTAPAISDSHIILEAVQNALPNGSTMTRNNTQGTTFDTGIVPSEDKYYRLDILCTTAGTIQMAINGAAFQSFTLPKFVATAGASNTSVRANNGEALLILGTDGGGNAINHPFGPGAQITVAGTGTSPTLDGTFITNHTWFGTATTNDRVVYPFASTVTLAAPTGYTVTGYASLIPVIMFGNDSQAAPATDNRICVDYFSFVWNPGVGGGVGTPDPTKARYF